MHCQVSPYYGVFLKSFQRLTDDAGRKDDTVENDEENAVPDHVKRRLVRPQRIQVIQTNCRHVRRRPIVIGRQKHHCRHCLSLMSCLSLLENGADGKRPSKLTNARQRF